MKLAKTQYTLSAADLEVVLAMVRAGTLARAGKRLAVDASTVFRAVQRIERGLAAPLFERSRAGYRATELAQLLAAQAEHMEAALEAARSAAQGEPGEVAGTVRITTTDTLLHGLVAPALKDLHARYPLLRYELHSGNEVASLTRRDADIAVRATRKAPPHLVGRHLGPIRVALYAAKKGPVKSYDDVEAGRAVWVAPDDALPDHPSVVWRQRHFPKATPAWRVDSILTVMELVALGLGVGLLPVFLAQARLDLLQLTEVIAECQSELWLLTHPESRHLRRVSAVFSHLAQHLALP
jgi:DNA-binding transcriptional LysR family regulator